MKLFRIATLMLMSVLTASAFASESADADMAKAADRFKKSASITADYTASANGDVISGKIVIAGEKFALTSASLSTWFDGTTQWTLDSRTNEVNVTEPTEEELQQVNPFAIISSFRKSFKPMLLKAPKGQYKVDLKPLDKKADIRHAVVTFNSSTYLPVEIQMTTPNGQLLIKVKNASTGGNQPVTVFRFNKSKYPKVKVVDLR